MCDKFRRFDFEDPTSPLMQLGSGGSRSNEAKLAKIKGHAHSPPPSSPAKKKEKDVDKPKRPMNGFMLFAKKYRLELIQQHPGKDNRYVRAKASFDLFK